MSLGDYVMINGRKVLVIGVFRFHIVVRYRCGTEKIFILE